VLHLSASDSFLHLGHLRDLNELLRGYDGWKRLISEAENWGMSNSLFFSLNTCKALFGLDVPGEVLLSLKPRAAKRALVSVFVNRNTILREDFRRQLVERLFRYFFFDIVEARSFSDYWAIFSRVFFPPREVLDMTRPGDRSNLFVKYIKRIFTGGLKVLFSKKSTGGGPKP